MGAVARMKSKAGGSKATPIITPVTTVDLSLLESSDVFVLTNGGAVTIPTINANMPIHAGRTVTLICDTSATGDVTITDNSATTTKGQVSCGGDIVLDQTDACMLIQRADGHWDELSLANNTP